MPKAVGVTFRPGGKIYYFDPQDLALVPGDEVIVPGPRGVEYGRVVTAIKEINLSESDEPLRKVLRRATTLDREQLKENAYKEEEAYRVCRRLIQKHGLPMKLVGIDYVFDGSCVVFYFTAEGRVDFRELVKDLASKLKMRIDLRQVGVRDEAKMVGGLGPCGRDLCCSLFLSDFEPVSIKMAKEQDLPLNPSKISGICGRLMCCLKYEFEVYEKFNEIAPPLGEEFEIDGDKWKVVGYDVPKESVILELESGKRIEKPIEEILRRYGHKARKARKRK